MKILHYTPKLRGGDILADHIAALVRSTETKNEVKVVSSQKAAIDAIKNDAPDIVHVHGSWRYMSRSVVRAARKIGSAVILSPHHSLDSYATRHEHHLTKVLRKTLYEKSLTQAYDALLVTTERECEQLLQDKWHDRIGVVPTSVLNSAYPENQMGSCVLDFYKKVVDTRYQLLMTDEEHIALQTLLHVGTLHDPSKRQISHESILKIRSLKPSQWRRIMLMADDEDISSVVSVAINVMQIDIPIIDAKAIDRFPLRNPKAKGSLPRTLLRESHKAKEVLREQSEDLQSVLIDLVNIHQLMDSDKLSLRHLSELFETFRYTDFNEDDFQLAVRDLGLTAFARRMTQVLATILNLDEGYFPVNAKDDKTTRRYIAQVIRQKTAEAK